MQNTEYKDDLIQRQSESDNHKRRIYSRISQAHTSSQDFFIISKN